MAGISAGVIGLPISEVIVSGNDTTQKKWVLYWAGIHPGDVLTLKNLRRARQELLDTDLFKSVELRAERYENGELALHIILVERHYWLLLPRVSRNSDGTIKYGAHLRVYNMQGADRTLSVIAQKVHRVDGNTSDDTRIDYHQPFFESRYELAASIGRVVDNADLEGFSNLEINDQASLFLSRDFDYEILDIPLKIAGGLIFENRSLDHPYPDTVTGAEQGAFNSLRLTLILDDIHSERYRQFGDYYSLSIGHGFDWLGSDYNSDYLQFVMIRKNRLNLYDNFDFRIAVSAYNESPFGAPSFGIGGASNVRGLESVDDVGNALIFGNFEYVFAYRQHPGLRHSLFVDIGNVFEDLGKASIDDLHYTIGTGFRWKIESFVKTDLFFDFGYDVEAGAGKLYGGTSLPF